MKHLIPLLSLGGVVAGPVYYTPRGDIEVQQESGLLPFFVSFVLFVVNSLRPPVLLHNRHPSCANRN